MMATITKSATRATPIKCVPATCRVPFGLMPVTAATAAMSTARPSQASQAHLLQGGVTLLLRA